MFRNERTIRDAVYRNFEIIGEAIKRLDPHVKGLSPDTPWQKIAGFRDILIHHYFGVDIEFVWSVIEQNLDDLEETVQTLLNQIPQNDL